MSTIHRESSYLYTISDPAVSDTAIGGGKAAGLHRLISANLPVPEAYCVTTRAFDDVVAIHPAFQRAIRHLDSARDDTSLFEGARALREVILAIELPRSFADHLIEMWQMDLGGTHVAVRSSATAEDLEGASFAGQQDTFLSIGSAPALLGAVRKAWASLFTNRAVTYRKSRGFPNDRVSMGIVVQRMVAADCAGVLFTADPVSGRRGVTVVEAIRGLGEAFVSGHVTPERYQIRTSDGHVYTRLGSDGARLAEDSGLLSGRTLEELRRLSARAEAHAKTPLDIEWATERGRVWLLQARPITTLWPLPEGSFPEGLRVLASFGHLQVYTSPLSRVGSSMFRRIIPFGRDERTGMSAFVRVAGDRLYVDTTPLLASEPFRTVFPAIVANASEPVAARLAAAKERPELSMLPPEGRIRLRDAATGILPVISKSIRVMLDDPRSAKDAYLQELHGRLAEQGERLSRAQTVSERVDILFDELGEQARWMLYRALMPRMVPALLLSKLMAQLVPRLMDGQDHRPLLQGLEGNVTTEMEFALADLSDLARDVPALTLALRSDDAVEQLRALRGEPACRPFFDAWDAFLARHGHRSVGEIDPGVPRFREDPRLLLRSIAGALERPKGALRAQHHELRQKALLLRDELVAAAQSGPTGSLGGKLTGALIDRMRTFLGLREEHKFVMVVTIDRLRAVVREAGGYLREAGSIDAEDDVWMLDLHEIRDAARAASKGAPQKLQSLVAERKRARALHETASPPAVITSEGEIIAAPPVRDAPPGSLAGTPVSGGVYEGIARVVFDPARETLGAGEILVTRFTDPGWTPLFGHAGALVMEVGGQMTHGSVIAREIGIPAVVAVEGATKKVRSGDRVRVDGDRGLVTVLEGGAA